MKITIRRIPLISRADPFWKKDGEWLNWDFAKDFKYDTDEIAWIVSLKEYSDRRKDDFEEALEHGYFLYVLCFKNGDKTLILIPERDEGDGVAMLKDFPISLIEEGHRHQLPLGALNDQC